jgi:rsbT antagonist protein RsbS
MRVPIHKQGGYLIASIQAALTDADLLQLQDDLSGKVGQFRSRAEVAFAMVQLGLTLEDVATALDLEEGLAYLEAKTRGGD